MATNYKDGSTSLYAPKSLMQKYQDALDDPELLSLRKELALFSARFEALAERVEEDVSTVTWKKFIALWTDFRFAIMSGDKKKQNDMLTRLNEFADSAHTYVNDWSDLQETARLRARLTEVESRRLKELQQTYTVEQVLYLLTSTIISLKEIVLKYADKETANQIFAEASVIHRRIITQNQPDN